MRPRWVRRAEGHAGTARERLAASKRAALELYEKAEALGKNGPGERDREAYDAVRQPRRGLGSTQGSGRRGARLLDGPARGHRYAVLILTRPPEA